MGVILIDKDFERGENYLLAIGINQYTSCSPLSNPVKDVRDLTNVLCDKYDFKPKNIVTLLDEQATRSAILSELKKLIQKLEAIDSLIIYFAGHGYYDTIVDEGYWISVNATIENHSLDPDQAIANSTIKKYLKQIPARHIFLISDSCFSGSFFVEERFLSAVREERFPSRWGLTSGRNEPVSDGNFGKNSPFARSLITYLSNTNKKIITTSDIIRHVKEGTVANSVQTPIGSPIESVGHQNGEFVLRLKITEDKLWNKVCAQDTIAAYEDYLENYPIGKGKSNFRLEATFRITELTTQLNETALWEEITSNPTIIGFKKYLKEYPSGKYSPVAREKLNVLELELDKMENIDWNEALLTNTSEKYLLFLDKYPKGCFYKMALEKNAEIIFQSRIKKMNERFEEIVLEESTDLSAFEKKHSLEISKILPDTENYKQNDILIHGLLETMMAHHTRLRILSKELHEPPLNSNLLASEILELLPTFLGEELRILFIEEMKPLTKERVNQIQKIHTCTIQFFSFCLMSELLEDKLKDSPVNFGEKLKRPLQAFFKSNFSDNYNRLLISLILQKSITESSFFLEELEPLSSDSSFLKGLDFFNCLNRTTTWEGGSQQLLFRINFLAEYYLTIVLSKLSFITKYYIIATGNVVVREIGQEYIYDVEQSKGLQFSFSIDSTSKLKKYSTIIPPHSLLLFKDLNESTFLRLSPFIFNVNSRKYSDYVSLVRFKNYDKKGNHVFQRYGDSEDILEIIEFDIDELIHPFGKEMSDINHTIVDAIKRLIIFRELFDISSVIKK